MFAVVSRKLLKTLTLVLKLKLKISIDVLQLVATPSTTFNACHHSDYTFPKDFQTLDRPEIMASDCLKLPSLTHGATDWLACNDFEAAKEL